MATIVTVHGTYASGPEVGEKWWQKNSPFSDHIGKLVDAEVGELTHHPFIWDGANSEASRRAAGHSLFKLTKVLEAQNEPYCIVGHSHGGSVISAALMESAKHKKHLDHMGAWITVGTPFITMKLSRFLFQRLGIFGKSVYVALLTVFLCLIFLFFVPDNINSLCVENNLHGAACNSAIAFVALLFLIPILVFHLLFHYFIYRKLHVHNNKFKRFAREKFQGRWVPLWHEDDEAIRGLGSLKELEFKIFSNSFAVKPLSLLSIFILPLTYWCILNSSVLILRLYDHAKTSAYTGLSSGISDNDGNLMGNGQDIIVNNNLVLDVLAGWVVYVVHKVFNINRGDDITNWLDFSSVFIIFLVAVGVAFVFTIVFTVVLKGVSFLFSQILNPVTLSQIRVQAFGSDTNEASAVDASDRPIWMNIGAAPLPEPLGAELQAISDAAVSKAVPQFRKALTNIAVATAGQKNSDMLSEYLTWNELIHTSYFHSSLFRKLVAIALVQSDGFRASSAFNEDPDYELVQNWYREIVRAADVA